MKPRPRHVVPSLALRWSHATGAHDTQVVLCHGRATGLSRHDACPMSRVWESNPRPHDYKSSALPTELTRRSRSEYLQAARRHSRHQPDTPTGVRWCLRAPLPFSQLRPRLAPERSSDLNEVPSLITDMTSGRRGGWDQGRPSWIVDRAPWSRAPARGRQCGRSASAVPRVSGWLGGLRRSACEHD